VQIIQLFVNTERFDSALKLKFTSRGGKLHTPKILNQIKSHTFFSFSGALSVRLSWNLNANVWCVRRNELTE
jgi:hypothetical protein